jgi:hypothetical protein
MIVVGRAPIANTADVDWEFERMYIGAFRCRYMSSGYLDGGGHYVTPPSEERTLSHAMSPLMVRQHLPTTYVPYWIDGDDWHFSCETLDERGVVVKECMYRPNGFDEYRSGDGAGVNKLMESWGSRGSQNAN